MLHLKDKLSKNEVYTIAEMSANHAGKLENALKIVHAAKKAGADCLKIQTYTADTITIKSDREEFKLKGGLWDGYTLYDLYSEAYTPWEWQPIIKEECDKVGIDFLSSPFDKTAVDFLEKINCEAYKIASFEIVDIPLIEYVASKKKPVIISCGMASEEEIQEALDACFRMNNKDIVLLKCCSEYPTNINNLNLRMIPNMKHKFNTFVGLSDHSMGYMADVIAVSMGAQVIEKHFCLSRKIDNADCDFSMEPDEFLEMVEKIRDTEKMMGNIAYGPSEAEYEEFKSRRSLYVVQDVKKGELFTEKNVRSIRPNNGMEPRYLKRVIGKKAKKNLTSGIPLEWEMIEKE